MRDKKEMSDMTDSEISYRKFLKKWPTLQDFSNATLEEIMLCWQGLGYYQRAKNIYKTIPKAR